MDQLSQAFAALADPTRRDLVARLAVGEATVGELAAPYDMSVQAVSKHLAVLERAGLVTKTKQAQRRPVRLEGCQESCGLGCRGERLGRIPGQFPADALRTGHRVSEGQHVRHGLREQPIDQGLGVDGLFLVPVAGAR